VHILCQTLLWNTPNLFWICDSHGGNCLLECEVM
jgi:hypothetical protein